MRRPRVHPPKFPDMTDKDEYELFKEFIGLVKLICASGALPDMEYSVSHGQYSRYGGDNEEVARVLRRWGNDIRAFIEQYKTYQSHVTNQPKEDLKDYPGQKNET